MTPSYVHRKYKRALCKQRCRFVLWYLVHLPQILFMAPFIIFMVLSAVLENLLDTIYELMYSALAWLLPKITFYDVPSRFINVTNKNGKDRRRVRNVLINYKKDT